MSSALNPQDCRLISADDVRAISVAALGLDASWIDLGTPEALAALVRYAASVRSPCSGRTLREVVLKSLTGLTVIGGAQEESEWRDKLDELIEALTVYGDLVELPEEDGDTTQLLYLAPPSFVVFDAVVFIVGGASDGVDALPLQTREFLEVRSHTRRLRGVAIDDVRANLSALGWIEVRRELWLARHLRESSDQLLSRANRALNARATTGEIPGLTVLDPGRPVRYYRGRWVNPIGKSGRFVARREQRYGADLWSYVELVEGNVTRHVDLPLEPRSDAERGCDAAWQLQMAIDAQAGHPQAYQIRPNPYQGWVIVDFFSPVPLWARRRWDVLGEEAPRQQSLFAYRFPEAEFEDVLRTLQNELWLEEVSPPRESAATYAT